MKRMYRIAIRGLFGVVVVRMLKEDNETGER